MQSTLTPRQMRAVAGLVIYARRLMILGLLARLKEDREEERRLNDKFRVAFFAMPYFVRFNHRKYVAEPAANLIAREGLIAQNGRWSL